MSDARKQSGTKTEALKTKYNPSEIEAKWQKVWEDEGVYQPDLENANPSKSSTRGKPFYNLMMFPYPSAEGLHVGNMYAFTGADVFGRFHRMQGNSVFEPIGLDGFGIHSENYALKVNSHPMDQAAKSEQNFYRQLHAIGNSYDWRHTVETWKPEYYKWTQWVFTELFKAGLAYRAGAQVNWCPSCKTVLADEQVIQKVKRQKAKGKSEQEFIEVSIGVCERCDTPVEKRSLEQWFFRITEYAERLLEDLEKIDWTEKVKIAQRNWIGRSQGATIRFPVILRSEVTRDPKNEISRSARNDTYLEVFTTRPDTLHGATFMVISPEHPLVEELLNAKFKVQNAKLEEIRNYIRTVQSKTAAVAKVMADKEKTGLPAEALAKEGVFSGLYAINPVNDQQIPIWIADYVLMGYGTGAIMAVPAHDQRDYDFAKKYDLPITEVVAGGDITEEAYAGPGKLVHSGEWNGWETPEAKEKATAWLEEHGFGQKKVQYHLRDWLISRQRYWGAPIPMIYCEVCAVKGDSWFTKNRHSELVSESPKILNQVQDDNSQSAGWYPVPEDQLPVLLPKIEDYRPVGTGKAPLANHPEFYETTCPGCGGPARRETDVADTFLDSSWYFLRYLATDLADIPFPMPKVEAESVISNEVRDPEGISPHGARRNDSNVEKAEKRTAWLPVDQYTGGAEHSVLHLLYSRFITKVFHDLGMVEFDEPFPKFFAHGLIIKEGAKMSKSKGNVVIPDEYIRKYGADTLRTYLMFLGPFSEGGDFQDAGIAGINKFLKRVWTLMTTQIEQQSAERHRTTTQNKAGENVSVVPRVPNSEIPRSSAPSMHRAIKGVTEDISRFRYNTAIAKLMTWYNELSDRESLTQEEVEVFLKLLAPFAPHMTEELYQRVGSSAWEGENKKEHTATGHEPRATSFQSIHRASWPGYDESLLVSDTVVVAIQVNGKLRDTLRLQRAKSREQREVEEEAKKSEKVKKFIDGKEIKKAIFVPGKILNLVV